MQKDKNIKMLDLESLKLSDMAYDYYIRLFNFRKIIHSNTKDIAAIPDICIRFIENKTINNAILKYPYYEFIEGFKIGYDTFNPDLSNDELKIWKIGRKIQSNYNLPTVSYKKPEKTPYFCMDKSKEYGIYMGEIFKAWEILIDNLPEYEKLLFSVDKSRFELTPEQINLLREETMFLTDEEKLNKVEEFVINEAKDKIATYRTDELKLIEKPIIDIYKPKTNNLLDNFKTDILTELSNPYYLNNIYKVNATIGKASKYIDLWIDWKLWEYYQNGIPENKNDSQIIPFPEYLKHNQNNELAELLKKKFAGNKGKKIALLISELTNRGLINIEYRERSIFLKSIREYFVKPIGTNSGINKYLTDSNFYKYSTHKTELETIKNEIDRIIKDLENK